jgi:hypothetical protein
LQGILCQLVQLNGTNVLKYILTKHINESMGQLTGGRMTPQQTAIVVSQAAQGIPGCKIAQSLGVHEATVSRAINQPDNRALIQREAEKIINGGLTISRKVLTRAAAEGLKQFKQDKPDKDLLKISIDASKAILNVAGLTGQPSTLIQALININQAKPDDTIGLLRDYLAIRQGKVTDVINSNDDDDMIPVVPSHTLHDQCPDSTLQSTDKHVMGGRNHV